MGLLGCTDTKKLNMPWVVPGTEANWHRTASIHTITLSITIQQDRGWSPSAQECSQMLLNL